MTIVITSIISAMVIRWPMPLTRVSIRAATASNVPIISITSSPDGRAAF